MYPLYIILVADGQFRVVERQMQKEQTSSRWLEIARETSPLLAATYAARDTDQAGRISSSIGHGGMSINEHVPMKEKDHRRALDWAIECIQKFMTPRTGEPWVLAAAPAMHKWVVGRLSASALDTLRESLGKNLMNTPCDEIASHFKSLDVGKAA